MNPMWKALPFVAVVLTGCAASSYCEDEPAYAKAATMPPLQDVEGLKLPQSASALRIPPPPPQSVPFGERYQDADGDVAYRCLDRPPELVSPPPASPTAEPAPTPESPPPAVPEADPSS